VNDLKQNGIEIGWIKQAREQRQCDANGQRDNEAIQMDKDFKHNSKFGRSLTLEYTLALL